MSIRKPGFFDPFNNRSPVSFNADNTDLMDLTTRPSPSLKRTRNERNQEDKLNKKTRSENDENLITLFNAFTKQYPQFELTRESNISQESEAEAIREHMSRQSFDSVEELSLTNEDMTVMPREVSYFKNLKILHVGNNYFNELGEISSLSNLEELEIFNNQLSSLKGIDKLTKLIVFEGYENEIQKIPAKLNQCKKIQHIDLSDNLIKKISATFNNFFKLNYLDVSNNPLKTNKPFKGLEINTLNLSETKLPPKRLLELFYKTNIKAYQLDLKQSRCLDLGTWQMITNRGGKISVDSNESDSRHSLSDNMSESSDSSSLKSFSSIDKEIQGIVNSFSDLENQKK